MSDFYGWFSIAAVAEHGRDYRFDAAQTAVENRLAAAVSGRWHWRTPALAQTARDQGDAQALLAAYRRYGERCFTYLGGRFNAAIYDGEAARVLAATDRLGQQPLYYARPADGGELLFATALQQLLNHPRVTAELDPQGIYSYVYFHMVPQPDSIYRGVHKLPAGHYLCYDGTELRTDAYWLPDFDQATTARPEQLEAELRQVLSTAVSRQLDGRNADRVAAFLSGGLDSSTVAGLLAKRRAEQAGSAATYSIGFDAQGYDEIPYARLSAKHFNTRQHEYYVTPDDVVDAVPLIARAYAEPFGNSSAIPTYYCAKLAAANGVQTLLAGDGGDELFAGNTRYAKQRIFEAYQRLPGGVQSLLGATTTRLPALSVLGKAQSYVRQASVPLPDRLQSYNYLHRIDPASVFNADFLTAIDRLRPLALLREQYRRPANADTLNRMLYLDWQFTLADNDLPKVSQMCAINGVEVAYPFLDDEVVEFSCRVPSKLKLKGPKLRYFFKQAMRAFLPPEVLTKSKHGFGLPFGVWMRTHPRLRQLGYDSLQTLRRRHYFQPAFLDRVIELHGSDHAAYYGELVWILMMLELWLQSQEAFRAAA